LPAEERRRAPLQPHRTLELRRPHAPPRLAPALDRLRPRRRQVPVPPSRRLVGRRRVRGGGEAAERGASALVDELFFEAHFYFDGIQFGWGALGADRRHTVDEALALMRTLRERGIRSHFWI